MNRIIDIKVNTSIGCFIINMELDKYNITFINTDRSDGYTKGNFNSVNDCLVYIASVL